MNNSCQDFLELQNICEGQFTTGLHYSGITVFNQQVRTLNLFYAMQKEGYFNNSKNKICIIGGGVSGLTFASAALKSNLKVVILEKEPILMSLQYGCDIRIIHPNIYDWPADGSTFPHARLPIMSWSANTASNVSRQFYQSFKIIAEAMKDNSLVFLNVSDLEINRRDDGLFNISGFHMTWGASTKDPLPNSIASNYIIYCTGFGKERESLNIKEMPSYWRNDNLSQLFFHSDRTFNVSGTGDGALIDLFRIKLLGFSYDSFLKYIGKYHDYDNLLVSLKEIQQGWIANRKNPSWLYGKINAINTDAIQYIKKYFSDHDRRGVKVNLLSKVDYNELFDLEKASFINLFCLYFVRIGCKDVGYKIGKTEPSSEGSYEFHSRLGGKTPLGRDSIFRHGTDRDGAFKDTPIEVDQETQKKLKEKQEHFTLKTKMPLWDENSLVQYFVEKERKGFFTNDTVSVCSSFTSMLSQIIQSSCKSGETFRLALHKSNNTHSSYCFQQITKYYGTLNSDGNSLGKLFPLTKGNVGLSITTGTPICLCKGSDSEDMIKLLCIEESKSIRISNSYLSIPIFGPYGLKKAVNLILYIDSNSSDFFRNDNRMELIFLTLKGWIDFIEASVDKYFYMDNIVGEPLIIDPSKTECSKGFETLNKLISSSCYDNDLDLILRKYIGDKQFSFSKYYSFDIYHKMS